MRFDNVRRSLTFCRFSFYYEDYYLVDLFLYTCTSMLKKNISLQYQIQKYGKIVMLEKYIVDSFYRQNSLSFGFRKVRCVELYKVKRNLKLKTLKTSSYILSYVTILNKK